MRLAVVLSSALRTSERRRLDAAIKAAPGAIRLVTDAREASCVVATTTRCPEYLDACARAVAVVGPELVDEFLRADYKTMDEATLAAMVARHRLKPLKGCVVCCTALVKEDKDASERLTKELGGQYLSVLNQTVTHLISSEDALCEQDFKSDKCTAARSWNIPVVSTEWLRQSAIKQQRLGEDRFQIKFPTDGTANPTDSTTATAGTGTSKAALSKSIPEIPHVSWPQRQQPTNALYLADCNVYLSTNIEPFALVNDIRRVLTDGAAVINDSLNAAVTHVIMHRARHLSVKEREQWLSLTPPPILVSPDWLRDCYIRQQQLPAQAFELVLNGTVTSVPKLEPTPAPTLTSATTATIATTATTAQSASRLLQLKPTQPTTESRSSRVDVFAKNRAGLPMDDIANLYGETTAPQTTTIPVTATQRTMRPVGASISSTAWVATVDPYFSSAVRNTMEQWIRQIGGAVVADAAALCDNQVRGMAIAIVPFVRQRIQGHYDNNTHLRTPYWLEQSHDRRTLLEANQSIVYLPSHLDMPVPALKQLVLAFAACSEATSLRREHLMKAARAAGAEVQDDGMDMRRTTHLIVESPHGKMFLSAQERQIQCILPQWLEECLASGTIVAVQKWQVTLVPNTPGMASLSLTSATPPPRTTASPMRSSVANSESQLRDLSQVLYGVVLLIDSKLSRETRETLQKLVIDMGGSHRLEMSNACTHHVHDGANRRPRGKKKTSRPIVEVAADWIYDCHQQGRRLNESGYPPTYDPRKAIRLDLSPPVDRAFPSSFIADLPADPPASSSFGRHSYRASLSPRRLQSPQALSHDLSNSDNFMSPDAATLFTKPHSSPQKDFSEMTVQPQPSSAPIAATPAALPATRNDLDKASMGPPSERTRSRSTTAHAEANAKPDNPTNIGRAEPVATPPSSSLLQPRLEATIEMLISSSTRRSFRHRTSSVSSEPSKETPTSKPTELAPSEVAEFGDQVASLPLRRQRVGDDGEVTYSDNKALWYRQQLLGGGAAIETGTRTTASIASSSSAAATAPTTLGASATERDHGRSPGRRGRSANTARRFQMSLIDASAKDRLFAMIRKLGGEVVMSASHDATCTHTVVGTVQRGEKVVASCASGVWLLRPEYVMDSDRAGYFLDEEAYEWGNPDSPQAKPSLTQDLALVTACRTWRLRIKSEQPGAPRGSFDGWRVLLCVDHKNADQVTRSDAFLRIFESGKATVRKATLDDIRKAIIDPSEFSHAFTISATSDEMNMMSKRGLIVLNTEMVFEFLINLGLDVSRSSGAKRTRV